MSNHWYELETGNPKYTVIGANGKERDTTLRDARKLKLVPSVTTIIGQLDKPALTNWKLKQLMNAVHLSNDELNYTHERYEQKIWEIYKQQTEQYSKEGTRIHDAIEKFYKNATVEPEDEDIIFPVMELIESTFKSNKIIKYRPEESFAHKDGFGGKIDLLIETEDGLIIIDFKTKQQDELSNKNLYIDYLMQLAAYSEAYENVLLCGNLLISTTKPGSTYWHEYSKEDIDRGKRMFYNLLSYWKEANHYE